MVDSQESFSGKISFRTTPEIHRDVYIAASRAGKSMNAWMEGVLRANTLQSQETLTDEISLSEYKRLLAQLQSKIIRLQSTIKPYLEEKTSSKFAALFRDVRPLLKDEELPRLLEKIENFQESLGTIQESEDSLLFLLEETNLDPNVDSGITLSILELGPDSPSYDKFFHVLQLAVSKDIASIGDLIEVHIDLISSTSESSNIYSLGISKYTINRNDVNIILNASGFQMYENNTTSLPLQEQVALQNTPIVQTAHFILTAVRPGPNVIKAEIYYGEVFETVLETTIQVTTVEDISLSPSIAARSRPVPQPDLTLQIQTLWNDQSPLVSFQYHLDSFHPSLRFASGIQQASTPLLTESLEQTRDLLKSTLENSADGLPEDFHAQLASLGQYLFQRFLPPELQQTFRTLMRFNQTFTLLILADQDAGLPWELLHDGQQFLGERLIIGRWAWELDQTRPYEFAIGSVNLAHYANVQQPELWTSLLEVSGAPPPTPLGGGMLADLSTVEAMRGLHLVRLGLSLDAVDRQDAPVPFTGSSEGELDQELQPIKLNLRRNRPLVSLGYLNAGLPELTMLEQAWAATFIRSGCSAFVGPLWAVAPTVETAFVSSFYHRLWAGDSLGIAFQAARRTAQAVAPDSLDWMAYVLFGDPMARPYRPTQGKGYAVVEPIGQEITDPVAPGASVRFRASLRRTPPVWYDNRLMDVAEDLAFNDLQIYVIASGLQVVPADAIEMQRTPMGDYVGWFTLTVPADRLEPFALVQVHFEDEMEPIHSLRFSLIIGDREEQA